MALRQPTMAKVSGSETAPVQFKVINNMCQLRPMPKHDYFSIGSVRRGTVVRGFPFIISGETWIRLHDEEAATYVPDRAKREDGVWLPQVHPKYGRLVQSQDEDARYAGDNTSLPHADAGGGSAVVEGGRGFGYEIKLQVVASYEEMLQAEWTLTPKSNTSKVTVQRRTQSVIEMVIDSASGRPPADGKDKKDLQVAGASQAPLAPAKGAIVKRVDCAMELRASVSNMPDGRYFLISVVVTFDNKHQLRSQWIRAATLHIDGRNLALGNIDPVGIVRGKCEGDACACQGFVPFGEWTMNSDPVVRCRRCGCVADRHVCLGSKTRSDMVQKAPEDGQGDQQVELPRDSKDWTERECNLWFWSNGALHPRENPYAARTRKPTRQGPAYPLADPTVRAQGKVSVVCPTMEDRQPFHAQVWMCFLNQTWPDKELIVIETYKVRSSDYFRQLVESGDTRLVYLKFRCGYTTELSIGAKRNIGQHIAQGDYIANFDDDDIYGPTYLETMVGELDRTGASFVTLSSWYFFDIQSGRFGFFDAQEWAHVKKMSPASIDGWLWGYGFSYLHRLQPALDKKINYPNQNMEEDITYIRQWKRDVGPDCAVLLFDHWGIVLHTLHGNNTSNSFGLREVLIEEIMDNDFADLDELLEVYLRMFPRQNANSKFIEQKAEESKAIRRYREIMVHWANLNVPVKCAKGVKGHEMRLLCADIMFEMSNRQSAAESIQLYRASPDLNGGPRKGDDRANGRNSAAASAGKSHPEQPANEAAAEAAKAAEPAQPVEQLDPLHRLLGPWHYGGKPSEYWVSRGADGQLRFDGPHSKAGTVTGELKPQGYVWLQADLIAPDGVQVGTIRLRYVEEVGTMVSNFKGMKSKEWGKDIIAHRPGTNGSGAGTSQLPRPAPGTAVAPHVTLKPLLRLGSQESSNDPIGDNERLGVRIKELWLVTEGEAHRRRDREDVEEPPPRGEDDDDPSPEASEAPPPGAGAEPRQEEPDTPRAEEEPCHGGAAESQHEGEPQRETPELHPGGAAPGGDGADAPREEAEPHLEAAAGFQSREAEPDREELDLKVYIDRNLGLVETVRVGRGSSIGDVKIALSERDITGQTRPEDLQFRWAEPGSARLSDDELVTGACTALEIAS